MKLISMRDTTGIFITKNGCSALKHGYHASWVTERTGQQE